MSERVTFKYFEGRDVDQFTFYRIPKQLFTVSYFKSLSSDAKILYGLMLDRISLSVKNHWFDEQNRAYIYFSIDDVMELLGCGRNKAVKCLKELDVDTGIGLTQKRRQGFGKSNMIYVKTFLVESQSEIRTDDHEKVNMDTCLDLFREAAGGKAFIEDGMICLSTTEENPSEYDEIADLVAAQMYKVGETFASDQTSVEVGRSLKGAKEQTSVSGSGSTEPVEIPKENVVLDNEIALYEQIDRKTSRESAENVPGMGHPYIIAGPDKETEKFDMQTNGPSAPDTEVLKANFKKSFNDTSRSPHNKLQEVYKKDPNKNKYNKTEDSYNKSYRIVSGDVYTGGDRVSGKNQNDGIRYDLVLNQNSRREESHNDSDQSGVIYALIRENIALEDLLAAREMDQDLIMEIYNLIVEMVSCRSQEVVIASSRYPAEIVRSRFLKIRYDHIIYVMDCLEKNTSKIKNIRKYLLAALFNAPVTMDGYYRAEVRHDMASAAW